MEDLLQVSAAGDVERLFRISAARTVGAVARAIGDIDLAEESVQDAFAIALDVWRRDGSIDALYTSLFRELLTYMMEDPRNISFCAHLLFVAKNVERIGDHSTNVAETIHYLVTGQSLTAERPKDDRSTHPDSLPAA